MASFSMVSKSLPNYMHYKRLSIFALLIDGTLGSNSMNTREYLNKILKEFDRFHTSFNSNGNIRKITLNTYLSDTQVENTATSNHLIQTFMSTSLFTSSKMFFKL
jgi:hypothetical protein